MIFRRTLCLRALILIPTGIKPLIFLLNQSIDSQNFARAHAIWAVGSSELVTSAIWALSSCFFSWNKPNFPIYWQIKFPSNLKKIFWVFSNIVVLTLFSVLLCLLVQRYVILHNNINKVVHLQLKFTSKLWNFIFFSWKLSLKIIFFFSLFNRKQSNSVKIIYKEEKETQGPQIYCVNWSMVPVSLAFCSFHLFFLFVEPNETNDN